MKIVIEDVVLKDDGTPSGGVAKYGETLADFILDGCSEEYSLEDINKQLEMCGIKPLELKDIKIVGAGNIKIQETL